MTTVFNHPRTILEKIDTDLGASEWVEISQSRIDQFAVATDDHQWIHVDPEKAKEGPFGMTVAHGYLTLALVNRFLPELMEVRQFTAGVNYGCNKVRFPAPVKVGAEIRGIGRLIVAEALEGGVQAVVRITVEIKGSERPACVAEVISRYYF